ncbi:hypothetical protein K4H28_14565 [Deefgea tanakiae]|uniref:Uncharacterized protein n=1 Tax=Deefgea tanakiae TaxID=2865840 RepID=A0ABX8Z4H7_9NEIS|nr:DUF6710 family protein [Deefgea tanakiae]QZA77487.1 hypothetical protein K4H28_14565 [Deefgea tanakiae]
MAGKIKSKKKKRVSALAKAACTLIQQRNEPSRLPLPDLPTDMALSPADQWTSLLWAIDAAESFGADGLRGLTLSLARIVQGEGLKAFLFDVRRGAKSSLNPETLLWDRDLAVNSAGDSLGSLRDQPLKTSKVKIRDSAFFAPVWERWRLIRALAYLGRGLRWGAWSQEDNHRGVAWLPWPLVWITNGNHSSMSALMRGAGAFKCYATYDLTAILQSVRTDGIHWYRNDDGSILGPVHSMAMAGIFVIGQRLGYETTNNDQA